MGMGSTDRSEIKKGMQATDQRLYAIGAVYLVAAVFQHFGASLVNFDLGVSEFRSILQFVDEGRGVSPAGVAGFAHFQRYVEMLAVGEVHRPLPWLESFAHHAEFMETSF